MRMKYIISARDRLPVVFSEMQKHSDVARALFNEIQSAGFCFINKDNLYTCYGESTSLGIASKGAEDSKILNQCFGLIEF